MKALDSYGKLWGLFSDDKSWVSKLEALMEQSPDSWAYERLIDYALEQEYFDQHPGLLPVFTTWALVAGLEPTEAKLRVDTDQEAKKLFRQSKELSESLKSTVVPENVFLVHRLALLSTKDKRSGLLCSLDTTTPDSFTHGLSLLVVFSPEFRKSWELDPIEETLPPAYLTAYHAILKHLKKS